MKKITLTVLALLVIGAVGAFLFAWSGVYSVAASKGHFAVVDWFLQFGMRNSVDFHAPDTGSPELGDALFERGIGHFHVGCAPCHGAPGFPPNPIAQATLPPPPDLSHVAGRFEPNELFWIVKHGLKYTGMPAWPAPSRDDEVWALVAFLERLPEIGADEYRRMAGVEIADAIAPAVIGSSALFAGEPAACARCHGAEGQGSAAGGVPAIAGQSPDYLAMTLADYASGVRPSGIMGPVAAFLDENERRRLAEHFGSLATVSLSDETPPPLSVDPAILQLGGALASVGDPEHSIAACDACHGAGRDPNYPALAGLHPAYLEQQLKLWRAGVRGGTYAEIMAAAVGNITDEQIRAVALYYFRVGALSGP